MEASSYNRGEVFNFKALIFVGYWRIPPNRSSLKPFYTIYSAFVLMMTTIYLLLQLADIKDSVGDLELLSLNLSGTSTSVFSLSELYLVRFKMEQIEKLRKDLNEFLNIPEIGKNEEDIKIFRKFGSNFTRTCNIFCTLVIITVTSWCIFPGLNGILPIHMWVPFDVESNVSLYVGVYGWQCMCLTFYGCIVMTTDLLQLSFISSIAAHFEVMKKNIGQFGMEMEADTLKNITDGQRRKNVRERLQKLLRHHQQILRVARELDSIFHPTNLIHLFGIGVLMSVCEFDLIQKTNIGMDIQSVIQSGNVASAISNLFIYSYYGSMLQESSFEISRALYEFPWYVLDPSSRRILVFMISRSQKPTRITAGRMVAINLATYLTIMKNSYNLLALLRRTR